MMYCFSGEIINMSKFVLSQTRKWICNEACRKVHIRLAHAAINAAEANIIGSEPDRASSEFQVR